MRMAVSFGEFSLSIGALQVVDYLAPGATTEDE